MDPSTTPPRVPNPLDHPMYRMAHLHGSEWVVLRPDEQHAAEHAAGSPWPGGVVYRCETCDEQVLVAPA